MPFMKMEMDLPLFVLKCKKDGSSILDFLRLISLQGKAISAKFALKNTGGKSSVNMNHLSK